MEDSPPPNAIGCPPYGSPADSGWPTSYIFCHWWTTDGPSVAMSDKSHPPTAASLLATGGPPMSFLPLIATGGPLE